MPPQTRVTAETPEIAKVPVSLESQRGRDREEKKKEPRSQEWRECQEDSPLYVMLRKF